MPDFVGTYRLAEDLPQDWRADLNAVAASNGIELRSAALSGNRQLTIKIRVPRDAPAPASEIASSFFTEVAQAFSGGQVDTGHVQLVSTASETRSFELIATAAGVVTGIAVSISVMSTIYKAADYLERAAGAATVRDTLIIVVSSMLCAAGVGSITLFGRNSRRELAARVESNLLAVQERALIQQAVVAEDPKTQARLELARVRLRSRASNMRGDADRLWRRSLRTFWGSCVFFSIAVAGPCVAAFLLIDSSDRDWHFMFGGVSLAAVPLAIGTALLRHDTKLREQYQEAARDVASLERYELALDYARIASPEVYQATMQQVITQLLSSRGDLPVRPSPPSGSMGKNEDAENASGVHRVIDMTLEKTGEIVAAIAPKKGI